MASYLENKRRIEELFSGSSAVSTDREEDFYIDKNATLKKDDLKKYEYLTPIRSYMVDRKGVDYKDKKDDELIEDFIQHMRYFNANDSCTNSLLCIRF